MGSKSRFLLDAKLAGPGEYVLNPHESHHAVSVMRLRPGDVVVVFDGMGKYADAEILDAGKSGVRVRVDAIVEEPHLPLRVVIATAIPKGKRWQALVEKCTELGVDKIMPLVTERSVAKGEGDAEKWRRWMVEAAKQCRRSRIPEIVPPARLADVAAECGASGSFILYADPDGESLGGFRDELAAVVELVAFIGPEGGLSDEEADALRQAGAKPVRLSPFILRIETAAATLCALVREVI